jgi:unsaturated pyranuronate lyase
MAHHNDSFHVHIWDELPADHPMDKIDRRRIIGQQAMISHVLLHKGFKVQSHHHENEQFAVVLSGRVRFGLGDPAAKEYCERILEGGSVLHLPGNTPHSAEALEDTLILDIFSPPSEKTGIDATD